MERKMMISSFINIKTKLWIWLVAVSFLLSACSSEISNRETEGKPAFPIEKKVTENPEVIKEEIVETEPEEKNVVHTEIFPKLPWIEEKTDNIIQIVMTGGNISALIFYYDKERAIVSSFYTESFYLRDN